MLSGSTKATDMREHRPGSAKLKHWTRTRHVTLLLLVLWSCVTVLVIFRARELSGIRFFGWPLSFYMAAQGCVLVYLALIGLYAWSMEWIDRAVRDVHEK